MMTKDHPSALVSVPREPTTKMLMAPDEAGVGLYSREVFAKIWSAMLSAAPAAPQAAGVGEREAIARICDPAAWRTRDEQYVHIERSRIVKDKDAARRNADAYVSGTLKKADLILALRAPSREPEGGAVDERLRGVVSMLERVVGPTASVRVYEHEAKLILTALTPKEAPAEAGEALGAAENLHAAATIYEDQALLEDAETVLKYIRAQPQAREDAQPFGYWVEHKSAENPVLIRHGSFVPASDHYKITTLYTRPAPDALRVAVEALEPFAEIAGRYLTGGMRADLEARSPSLLDLIEPRDFYRARTALAALQAEQKGGA